MMNGRHMPAGQGMPPQHDMNRRQRPYNHHHNSHNAQHYQTPAPMYNGYPMNPYANFQPQYPIPHAQYPHYQGMSPNQYPSYPQPYGRSPPPQYPQYNAPPAVVSSHPRPLPQQSPAIVTSPYSQPPPQPQIPTPAVPSNSNSDANIPSQSIPSMPSPQTPQTTMVIASSSVPENALAAFQPPLPWTTHPEFTWPSRPPKSRRRRRLLESEEDAVELPSKIPPQELETHLEPVQTPSQAPRAETPSTAQAPSENAPSTTPTTPISAQQSVTTPKATPAPQPSKPVARPAAAIPILPVVPKQTSRPSSSTVAAETNPPASVSVGESTAEATYEATPETQEPATEAPVAPSGPKAWASLFKGPKATPTSSTNGSVSGANGVGVGSVTKNNDSLSGFLQSFDATSREGKLAFVKPRGLKNKGNMCYMNSVLQILVFCVPFYDFLDQISKRMVHSIKSETPLIDAMIMFMREFPVITSAETVEQLKRLLRADDLEKYGEAFTPEFVYKVINEEPLFANMRNGQQEDAEEFLGFLLAGLHDECAKVMQSSGSAVTSNFATPTNIPSSPVSEKATIATDGWLEVGPKQRAATTQSSGNNTETPVSKIFGGTQRSELKIPGQKLSVTLEPFRPFQLDIGSPTVHNIVDALKASTVAERLGDHKSDRGQVIKQNLIETLPPVLILHLKRFQYDSKSRGTQKIWKKIGYPLELEIPKDVFSRQKQATMINHGGLPKYRLIGVVYHHGKNASGGHYTVDVRRQDGQEWVRLDDTVIRRVSKEDIAEGGSEEDPKVIAATKAAHKLDNSSANIFEQFKEDDGEDSGDQDEWKQVNGVSNSEGKKWSSVANGTATKAKNRDVLVRDNKVAYILFYQRI